LAPSAAAAVTTTTAAEAADISADADAAVVPQEVVEGADPHPLEVPSERGAVEAGTSSGHHAPSGYAVLLAAL